jgi:Tfp pilus assembly protein PilF
LAKNPEFVPALNNLAYIYADKLNNVDKAYELAQKARKLRSDPSVADTLGWVLYKKGDYQQAQTLLQESAGKLPQNSDVQFHLGMASYMMGQADTARAAFQQALKGPQLSKAKKRPKAVLVCLTRRARQHCPVSSSSQC